MFLKRRLGKNTYFCFVLNVNISTTRSAGSVQSLTDYPSSVFPLHISPSLISVNIKCKQKVHFAPYRCLGRNCTKWTLYSISAGIFHPQAEKDYCCSSSSCGPLHTLPWCRAGSRGAALPFPKALPGLYTGSTGPEVPKSDTAEPETRYGERRKIWQKCSGTGSCRWGHGVADEVRGEEMPLLFLRSKFSWCLISPPQHFFFPPQSPSQWLATKEQTWLGNIWERSFLLWPSTLFLLC